MTSSSVHGTDRAHSSPHGYASPRSSIGTPTAIPQPAMARRSTSMPNSGATSFTPQPSDAAIESPTIATRCGARGGTLTAGAAVGGGGAGAAAAPSGRDASSASEGPSETNTRSGCATGTTIAATSATPASAIPEFQRMRRGTPRVMRMGRSTRKYGRDGRACDQREAEPVEGGTRQAGARSRAQHDDRPTPQVHAVRHAAEIAQRAYAERAGQPRVGAAHDGADHRGDEHRVHEHAAAVQRGRVIGRDEHGGRAHREGQRSEPLRPASPRDEREQRADEQEVRTRVRAVVDARRICGPVPDRHQRHRHHDPGTARDHQRAAATEAERNDDEDRPQQVELLLHAQ